MIPILFESTETSFTSNGIGRLADCVSCLVTEERNGIFEVEFQYPVAGKWYSEITEGRIIYVIHDDGKTPQPFIIYRRSAPIDGLVTFNAHHVSYDLAHSILQPFTASSVTEAFSLMASKSLTGCGFTFWTNKATAGNFKVSVPISIKEILGGVEGSILDVYGGGEYEWNKFQVRLWQNRGTNNGVTLRYKKNITDLTQDKDVSGMYNACIPYWTNGETTVSLTSVVKMTGVTDATVAVPLDLSDAFEEPPTTAQLEAAAQTRIDSSNGWKPDENIEIDFVALWQTDEYENVAPLQTVKLCDTVTVVHPELGLTAEAKVIRVVYNALLEKYDEIEIGDPKTSFADTLASTIKGVYIDPVASTARNALKIAGDTDQHFWFTETGTDTGAHITRLAKEDFLEAIADDPTTAGENLIARSNGVAVRDGLTELAIFSASGAQIGLYASRHVLIDEHGFQLLSNASTEIAHLGYGQVINSSGNLSYDCYFSLGKRKASSNIGGSSYTAGYECEASGYCSFAEGEGTIASGKWSHAEGMSYPEGNLTTEARGNISHAEGYGSVSSGDFAHSEGRGSVAGGDSAHAQNEYTIASSDAQTAIGKFNVEDNGNKFALIIGNGTAGNSRSNALTVDWHGIPTCGGIKMLYRTNDTIPLGWWYGGGSLTNDNKKLLFSVPLGRIIQSYNSLTLTSLQLVVRQGGSYLIGSGSGGEEVIGIGAAGYSVTMDYNQVTNCLNFAVNKTTSMGGTNNDAVGIALTAGSVTIS